MVLLPKLYKPVVGPASYRLRLICLLGTKEKTIKRAIYDRLLSIAKNNNGLPKRRYGFRRAHSMDAIKMVVNLAKDALSHGACYAVLVLESKMHSPQPTGTELKGRLTGIPGKSNQQILSRARYWLLCYIMS